MKSDGVTRPQLSDHFHTVLTGCFQVAGVIQVYGKRGRWQTRAGPESDVVFRCLTACAYGHTRNRAANGYSIRLLLERPFPEALW